MDLRRPSRRFSAAGKIITVPTFCGTLIFSAARALDVTVGKVTSIAEYVIPVAAVHGSTASPRVLYLLGAKRGLALAMNAQITAVTAIAHANISSRKRLAVRILFY